MPSYLTPLAIYRQTQRAKRSKDPKVRPFFTDDTIPTPLPAPLPAPLPTHPIFPPPMTPQAQELLRFGWGLVSGGVP